MKTLETNCRVCGASMRLEIEETTMFTDEGLCAMACCDFCLSEREATEKAAKERYDKQVEKELRQPEKPKPWRGYRKPYQD